MVRLKGNSLYKSVLKVLLLILYILIGALGFPNVADLDGFKNVIAEYYIIGLIFILMVSFFSVDSLKKDLKTYFSNFKKYSWLTLKYLVITFLLFMTLRAVSVYILPITSSGNNLINDTLLVYPLYVFFVTVIYVPFIEGVIFRKYLHDLINNKVIFIILSSIFYGYLHIAGDYSSWAEFAALFIPIWAIGLGLAYSYVKTKNIFVPILCHFIYNFFVFILLVTQTL